VRFVERKHLAAARSHGHATKLLRQYLMHEQSVMVTPSLSQSRLRS
jgi:hypothetical protein